MASNLLILLILSVSIGCTHNRSTTWPPTTSQTIKIAFGSCVQTSDSQIWNAIAQKDPDLFVFLGDNVYLESPEYSSLEKIRQRYEQIYSEPSLINLLAAVPHVATWSDHDFGPNNSDSIFKYKQLTYKVFKERWPTPSHEIFPGSIAKQIELEGVTLLISDDRTFRVNPGRPGKPQLFGQNQMQWLTRQLLNNKNPVIILASAGQVLSRYSFAEGLYQYPDEELELHEALSKAGGHPLVISGDIHFAQIYNREIFDRNVTEVTSSPLNARLVSREKVGLNPPGATVYTETPNFGMISIDFGKAEITTEIFNVEGEVVLSSSERI